MKSKSLLLIVSIFLAYLVNAEVPESKGLWQFNDSTNLGKATIGVDLVLTGTSTAVSGPVSGNGAVEVGLGSYYTMTHGMAANGGGVNVNEWTMQFDFMVPTVTDYVTFFQTDTTNTSDGDLFVHHGDGSIGTSRSTYSSNLISPNTWYRLVITVKQNEFHRVYINGELWAEAPDLTHDYFQTDNRWSLEPKVIIFGDNDGDDATIMCSGLAIWDEALTAEQVQEMGDANTDYTVVADVPQKSGLWLFNDSTNLVKATIGTDLVLTGTETAVSGPADGNGAVEIGLGSYYTMTHGMAANGGGVNVNEWTMQFDFMVPTVTDYVTFFQTDTTNTSDGDLFVHHGDGSIGTSRSTYSSRFISPNTWYRMVITVKQTEFHRVYINGELWAEATDLTHDYFQIDNRWSLEPQVIVFGDNDGDDATIDCAELAIWDVALTAEQVAALGDVNTLVSGVSVVRATNENQLGQNYPNPFSGSTTVPYVIVNPGKVSFRVFDIRGNLVRSIDEGIKYEGEYQLQLSSENFSSGIYYLQMITDNKVFTRKMIYNR